MARLLLVAVLALSSLGCVGVAPPARLRPSGVAMELWKDPAGHDLAFPDYAARVASILVEHRWRIPGERDTRKHRRLIAPREWPLPERCGGRGIGVLLLHGLGDTPFIMADLGEFFAGLSNRCLLVRSILLPGHGTAPGDLLGVRYEQWGEAVRYGIRSFPDGIDGLYLVGFSTGAALALHEALAPATTESARRIRALVLLSPAIRPTNPLAHGEVVPRVLETLSQWSGIEEWLRVRPDRDYAKYESFPTNAGYQVYRLDEALAATSPRAVPVPMFMALSREDATVEAATTMDFFRTRADAASRLLLYARDPEDPGIRAWRGDARVAVLPSPEPERRILDFAHISLPVRPDNAHYGERGDYVDCLHYESPGDAEAAAKFCRCALPTMRPSSCGTVSSAVSVVYGEVSRENLERGILRRLTYNPLFQDLLRRLADFLTRNP